MRKFISVVSVVAFLFCVSSGPANAGWFWGKSEEYKELAKELAKGGVSDSEINTMEGSLQKLLKEGGSKEDVKNVAMNMVRMGLFGRDLKSAMANVEDLVSEGESVKEAGNIVSKTAHAAKAKGLKGRAMAEEIHKAIAARKAKKNKMKRRKRKKKRKAWRL